MYGKCQFCGASMTPSSEMKNEAVSFLIRLLQARLDTTMRCVPSYDEPFGDPERTLPMPAVRRPRCEIADRDASGANAAHVIDAERSRRSIERREEASCDRRSD